MSIWAIYCIEDITECLYLLIWPFFRFLGRNLSKKIVVVLEILRHLTDILKLTDLYRPSISMRDICKYKQLFWILHNSFFVQTHHLTVCIQQHMSTYYKRPPAKPKISKTTQFTVLKVLSKAFRLLLCRLKRLVFTAEFFIWSCKSWNLNFWFPAQQLSHQNQEVNVVSLRGRP